MNERIKELAELAAHDTRAIHNNAYWRMQEELAEDITWREKFAELIVEEFRSVLADVSRECPIDCAGNFLYADEKIAEHFYLEKK